MKRALAILAALALAGCAGAPPVTPVEVVKAQVDAVRAGDLATAQALLAPEVRARAPGWPERASLPVADGAREVRRIARWPGGGEELVVQRDAAGWRITSGVLGLFVAQRPEQALTTLARAVLARDYEALLALLPRAERGEWTASRLAVRLDGEPLRARWVALAEALSAGDYRVTWVAHDHAQAALSGGRVVTLRREEDGWKVFDVAPNALYTGR